MNEPATKPKRILAIASGGGHWVQLLRLRPAFEGCEVVYSSVRPAYADDVPGETFIAIPDATRWDRLKLLWMMFKVAWLVGRVRPDVVISTGAAPGYVAIRLGRLVGARTIWLDSIANVEEVSMSGQKIGPHADLWLTQWEHLASEQGPEWKGAVI
ncbi:MAG: UDP-N-acetylglucosamine--LPS N-acetylglucosamine transferase [Phycisphaerales bacterium JB065]